MKNQNLKLEFIENGRLFNREMSIITGGAEPCPTFRMCQPYIISCVGAKNICDVYLIQK